MLKTTSSPPHDSLALDADLTSAWYSHLCMLQRHSCVVNCQTQLVGFNDLLHTILAVAMIRATCTFVRMTLHQAPVGLCNMLITSPPLGAFY